MTIKTVSRRNWPDGAEQTYATWYEPYHDPDRIRAGRRWVLAHDEITGLATAGDVRLLGMIIAAERDRLAAPTPSRPCATTPSTRRRFCICRSRRALNVASGVQVREMRRRS